MLVKDYKNYKWRDEKEEGNLVGEAKKGVHWIKVYVKDNKFYYNSSKRCKKLLAIADYVMDLLNKNIKDKEEIKNKVLDFFKEEKEKDKIKDRLNLVLKALNLN